jgi:hypothetical protein
MTTATRGRNWHFGYWMITFWGTPFLRPDSVITAEKLVRELNQQQFATYAIACKLKNGMYVRVEWLGVDDSVQCIYLQEASE